MIQFIRLDHVLICIPEGTTAQAREFYRDVLGLEEIPGEHPSGAIWFKIADIQIHLREEAGGNYSKRHPAFEVANLTEAKQSLISKGLAIEYSSEIDGRERCFFRDPFDNRIELIEFID
ncbi:VOC family protein [Spirosoma foliorum]|uniref:Phage portal protein n=1 Tax=Spirosoma foliorum TaxID=2710596 RepID=A0A7G5GNF4_9BACT|nr:VOC family protein [Spirosoma foliorum]QMW00396.1 phage portal protein [Spirosoma foliorum]